AHRLDRGDELFPVQRSQGGTRTPGQLIVVEAPGEVEPGKGFGLVKERAIEGDASPDELPVVARKPGRKRAKARCRFLRIDAGQPLDGEEDDLARAPGLRQVAVAFQVGAWIGGGFRERIAVEPPARR